MHIKQSMLSMMVLLQLLFISAGITGDADGGAKDEETQSDDGGK